jgi:enolase
MYAGIPLYRHIAFLADRRELSLPTPSFNILNGGQHADNSVDVQEFMVMPAGVKGFAAQVQAGAEIFHALKGILASKKYVTAVGDEGGFAPNLKSNSEALDLIKEAVAQTKWKWGKNIFIALDPAASEFYEKGKYVLRGDGRKKSLSAQKMIDYWADWVKDYPIISIEDPLDQDDHKAWIKMTEQLGNDIQVVGDDFLVTNPERIEQAIHDGACNALLVKYNQIGTLSEAIKAVQLAQAAGWKVMVSHRSGETTDTFLADLAVGVGADQIKSGSLSRGERLCKYNRLMEIERELEANELDA